MATTIREQLEARERQNLSPHACLSSRSRGRLKAGEAQCDLRTDFQRDRDRIIHSKTFRRLKHKTQVFLAPAGDHYRTCQADRGFRTRGLFCIAGGSCPGGTGTTWTTQDPESV